MTTTPDEDALRARLHRTIDPRVPGPAAEHRVLAAIAEKARPDATAGGFTPHIGRRAGAVLGAVVAVAVVGGALTISLALRNQAGTGHHAPAGVTVPIAVPTPSMSPSPSPAPSTAAVRPCAADVLTATLHDQAGSAGTVGGDIALRNGGALPCTLEGYVNLQGIVGGRAVQLGVTHSAGGTLLNNINGTLPRVRLITVRPGYNAYVAFEDSDVINGPTPCSATNTLLITPPQGGRHITMTGGPISLCGGFGASLWIDIAPVSSAPYFP